MRKKEDILMRKKLICVFLCLMVLLAAPVYATNDPSLDSNSTVGPLRTTYISSCSANLSISSSGTASVQSSITGVTGVTSVKIVASLQRYSGGAWTTLQSWTETAAGRTLTLYKTRAVTSGYTYRVSSKVTAYNGSYYETATVISSQVSY